MKTFNVLWIPGINWTNIWSQFFTRVERQFYFPAIKPLPFGDGQIPILTPLGEDMTYSPLAREWMHLIWGCPSAANHTHIVDPTMITFETMNGAPIQIATRLAGLTNFIVEMYSWEWDNGCGIVQADPFRRKQKILKTDRGIMGNGLADFPDGIKGIVRTWVVDMANRRDREGWDIMSDPRNL